MTSRLKHKLELDNVNLNSAYLNESFVMIGTPLPALAETRKDQLEYVPEWNQEVRDEQGRRRFHGAFTGGFSAGYYNSVGSKEGWAPQTFKSSRNNRSKKQQRAEDFMDEEDLAQMNEDRKLENTETFRSDAFAGTKEELGDKGLPSSLESLIAPARTSIGQSLLQKLGWRPGQGIGPRVTLRKLRRQEGQAVKRDGEDEEMDDVEAGKHTFAPRDAKLLVYQAKEDREGLGYEKGKGMGRLPGQRGPAFGVGHVEDDEDDPYGASTSGVGPYVFDNAADNNDEIIVMGGPSRPGLSSGAANGGRGKEGDERWHDGRPLLSGFQLDPLGVPPDKWFEMPEIPPDWRPRPARVWGTTRRLEEKPGVKVEEKEVIRGAPGKPLTFEQRGETLGEEQRISTAKSVFEYISEKDRDRLASIAAAAEQPAPPPPFSIEPEPEDLPRPPADEIVIPPLSPRTASAALKGFVPYGDDPARQDRYRSYLSSQTYNTQTPIPDLKPAASFDEINKELEGFASSARIFKPMSFAMSSRFTSGSTSLAATDLKQAKPGLHLYDAEKAKAEAAKPKIAEAEVQRDLTPRQQAAANGMFGTMTREVKEFHPVKLLCKRFGVADPHPEGEPAKIETGTANTGLENLPLPKNDASWESQFVHQPGTDQVNPSAPVPSDTSEERRPRTLAEVGMAEDVNQGRDTLTYTKPSIDIFKAIFASDDDDDDDEEVEVKPAVPAAVPVEGVSDPFPVPERVVDEGPVDLATFKPVFAVHRERDDKGKEERRKEKKEKKKRKGVLSFDVSEDREDVDSAVAREEKKRKKRESDNGNGDAGGGGNESRNGHVRVGDREGDGEWVEKPAVKPRLAGRMGAADFM